MDFLYGYSENKLKPYLKMAVQRIQIATNKKSTSVKHQKREIAQLLADHKDEKARIKVEHIIREDFTIEAYEMLELLLELLHERIRQVTSNKEVPMDLKEAVCSLIWAASNVDISEFQEIKKQLAKKYGAEFAKAAEANEGNVVNSRLFQKLTYRPPSTKLVMGYLVEIAKGYGVDWTPSETGLPEGGVESDQPLSSPQGFSIPMAPGSELRSVYERTNNDNNQAGHGGSSSASRPTPDSYELEEQRQFQRHQQLMLQQQQQQQHAEPVVVATLVLDDHPQQHLTAPHLNPGAIPIPVAQSQQLSYSSQLPPQLQQQNDPKQLVQQQEQQQQEPVPPAVAAPLPGPASSAAANQDAFSILQARLAALHQKP